MGRRGQNKRARREQENGQAELTMFVWLLQPPAGPPSRPKTAASARFLLLLLPTLLL
jgi:hypothetical protein